MLARLAEHPYGRGSGPDQVAHRLVRRVRHPDGVSSPARCSLAKLSASRRSVFTRSPGLARDQGRRHHHAGVAEPLELPLQAVATRAAVLAGGRQLQLDTSNPQGAINIAKQTYLANTKSRLQLASDTVSFFQSHRQQCGYHGGPVMRR